LLDVFWRNVDPTQADGQFCDRGNQYRSAIFVSTAEQRVVAERSRQQIATELSPEIVTPILDSATFWIAEEYHQDFYKKEPAHYARYRLGCGRDSRLEAIWGD
jgi:peptide-methionine (S)-S-oxide reductase